MADLKISQLTSATTPLAGTEVLPIVQGGTTDQVSVANLTAGRAINAASLSLTTPLAVTNGGTGTSTAFTTGSVVFAGASGVYSQANTNFFWDNSNARLGIATASPSAGVDIAGAKNVFLSNKTAAPANSQSLPGYLEFNGFGWNTATGSQPIGGRVTFAGAYASGNVIPYLAFSLQASNENMTEYARIDPSSGLLLNTTTAYANLVNYNKVSLLSTGSTSDLGGNYSITNKSTALNNSTVDSLRFLNPAGTVIGANAVSGIVNVYVKGTSGANSYAANYQLNSLGNGTSNANLTIIGSATTRGTSPVASVQLAADGAGGAVKVTVTYINNSGVVDNGLAIVSFNGILF